MRAWIGRIAFVVLTTVAVWSFGNGALLSQTPGSSPELRGKSDGMQVVSSLLPTGVQQIVVVEAEARTMAVYHIDPVQGKIQLKSVRNLVWDLRMDHFNGQNPLPSELRQVEP